MESKRLLNEAQEAKRLADREVARLETLIDNLDKEYEDVDNTFRKAEIATTREKMNDQLVQAQTEANLGLQRVANAQSQYIAP